MSNEHHIPLVAHIILALDTGGLENGLVNIINRIPAVRYRHATVCLTEARQFSKRITTTGVTLFQLHKQPGHDLGLCANLSTERIYMKKCKKQE